MGTRANPCGKYGIANPAPTPPSDPCAGKVCPDGKICVDGICVPDPNDPCAGVVCDPGYECVNGVCVLIPTPDPENIPVFNRTLPNGAETYSEYITEAMDWWETYVDTPEWLTRNVNGAPAAIQITVFEEYSDPTSTIVASVSGLTYRPRENRGRKFLAIDTWKLRVNTSQWAQISELKKYNTMKHELGHCIGLAKESFNFAPIREFLGFTMPVDQYLTGSAYSTVTEQYNNHTGLNVDKTPLKDTDQLDAHWSQTFRDNQYFGYNNEIMLPTIRDYTQIVSQQLLEFYRLFGYQILKNGGSPNLVTQRSNGEPASCDHGSKPITDLPLN